MELPRRTNLEGTHATLTSRGLTLARLTFALPVSLGLTACGDDSTAGDDGQSSETQTVAYVGTVVRGGTLIIRPKVVISVPLFDEQVYEIPEFTVDLALGESPVAMHAEVPAYGPKPEAGDAQEGKCSDDGGPGATTSTGSGRSSIRIARS